MHERRANPNPIRIEPYPLLVEFLSLIVVIGIGIGCFQLSIAVIRWFGWFPN